ncbi:hypothetical protein V8G54_001988 [Vigna mungo]|uniref:Integrase catalytic domain-containing protein n=1 Tax=Vigna mungo TaxID=3915 RepID=A0AAQ3P8T8_VIGMU
MANNNSSSISNPHEPSKPFTCITLSTVTKLLPSNYLTWKLQVEALLDGYDLLKYPDGSFPASPMIISTTGVPPTPNPDRLIYGALLTTLSPEVTSLVSQTTTSHDLWTLLQRTYAKASRSHLKQLKERLHTTSKGTQSITTYMHSLKQTADLLASLGSPVSVEDMTDHVLRGLDDGYRAVIDSVNARDTPILFYDLLEKLPIQELSLVAAQRQVPAPMTALNAQTRPNHYYKTRSRQFSTSSSSRPSNHKPFLGRCQWCNVKGHVLSQCHTFKQQHPGVPLPPRSSSVNPKQVQVHTTTAGTSQNNFLVDSGATHHVTNDLDNLALHHPYMGPDSLFMGNGSGQITHNGSCVDGLYLWPANSPSVHSVCTDSSASWHHRLGHPSSCIFTFIQQHFSLGSNKFQQSDCNSCQINKSHKLPFSESTLKSSYPLEIIFSDVWASHVLSIDGLRYLFHDVQTLFPKFKSLVENFFHRNIKILYTDNGGEYIGLRSFLSTHGISHHTTPPHTPEHNGISECRNWHIAETGLSLLHHSGLPLTYWPHAMTTAAYLINRYSADQHAYLCLDPTTGRIYTSHHVKFVESEFSYSSLAPQASPSVEQQQGPLQLSILHPINQPMVSTTLNPPEEISAAPSSSSFPNSPTLTQPSTKHSESPSSPSSSQCFMPSSQPNVNPNRIPQTDGGRIITRSKNNIVKPIQKLNLHVQPCSPLEPSTNTQALRDLDWRSAMQAEFDALHRNNTWELVSRSSTQNLVGCKWVFRIKRHLDCSIDRYKARLVAKGFHQRPGWDYTKTFSPVVKPVTIRIVLTLAVRQGWSIRQLDVNNAFLQGTLEEEVFMLQPLALYGLKQEPRAWYTELRVFLLYLGFVNSTADASLIIYQKLGSTLYLLVYVDDIIVTGSSSTELSNLISTLAARFSLKDLGFLNYFLGVKVIPSAIGLFLSQRKYITDLLHKSGMANTKPASTPLFASAQLLKDSGDLLPCPTEYRALVGSLQYLSLTRPDIAFSTNKLAQFMQHPRTTHWSALKRVLRYLAGSCNKGIFISATGQLTFHAYSDADWAGDKDDYISTTAEYKALADIASELLWVLSLFTELGHMPTINPVIYCDNLGATTLSANPVFHSRMKHTALAYHFVRENVQKGKFRVSFVSTDDQLADILTKPMLHPRFDSLLSKLHLSSRSSNLREDINYNN